jgi:putative transcriptional regulator
MLPDPNFDRTVVLLLAYGEEGALGLVLNRPSDTLVAAPLPGWENLAADPAVVFVGGPVQHRAVICLARVSSASAAWTHPGFGLAGWRPVTGSVGTLDMDIDPGGLDSQLSHVRVFAGYAGWGPGQLEAEIAAGAWWAVDAQAEDPFCDVPDDLWKRVLRRQTGPLVLVSYYPDDPRDN